MRNFRSYFGDEARFDFRDRRFLGIVGPIGSGKSSVLDAISYALYGKTPTVASATKSLIHQRAADGAVTLRFEVEGEVWEAARLLRVKGQSQHALYRLEEDTPEAEPAETITQEGEVNAKIVELLGLEFDAFRRSVLLAQGKFAEFLSARPAERDKVLKGVFGHDRVDRMRAVAKSRAGELGIEIEKVAVRVEQLERVAARIGEHKAALEVGAGRLSTLERTAPKIDAFEQAIGEHNQRVDTLDAERAELERHVGRLPAHEATQTLLKEASEAADRRAELAERLAQAQADAHIAEGAVTELEVAGSNQTIEEAVALLGAAEPQEKVVADLEARRGALADRSTALAADQSKARQAASASDEALAAATTLATTAAEGLERAQAALHAAEHAGMAVVLRAELAAGDSCPVCAQDVAVVPEPGPDQDLNQAETEASAARAAVDAALARRTEATADQRGSGERLVAVEESIAALALEEQAVAADTDEAKAVLAESQAKLEQLLGGGEPLTALEGLREHKRTVMAAAADARKVVDRVRHDHDQAIRDEQATAREVSRIRLELTDLAARLDVDPGLGDSPGDLGCALNELRKKWSERTTNLVKELEAARAAGAEAARSRRDLLGELEITGDFAAAVAEVTAQIGLRTIELGRDEEELAVGDELREGRDRLAVEQGRYQRIASDLTDSRFVRFLLDEERARLAALGSDHFQRLSSGRYRFDESGGFGIIDLTAADARRRADSLSGGETFLASLALALALAEMVARTGGRLDSFFLDEGFGALDPEHLDLAMEGIEALVAEDQERLVVVVSHVPELRHRIEDLIELDRDPTTGDTKILSA